MMLYRLHQVFSAFPVLNSAYVTKVIMVVVTFVYFIFTITGYMRFPY